PWKEDKDVPLIIICDLDIGGLLGRHIQKITDDKIPVLCIDGVEVSDLDFLDLGSFLPGTGALPVVVKSLLFPTAEARVGSGTTADS
ncbi:MAG: ethanolamine ammonia-lyase reactivating factor EutA, partial [Acidimicrobiaceae bacterium]|nr:ethanolamine ammonia-lyase reactivating factor EutA [Acidimicrobiaceae bacterium]